MTIRKNKIPKKHRDKINALIIAIDEATKDWQ